MSKRTVKLTESELKRVITESVKKILRESDDKKKLQNSFKSKEDMTQYRDLYDPRGEDEGPYMRYHSTTFDDMDYDYCGDDMYNDEASDYNARLKKRLATKGGQMSYDWDTEFGREASMAKNARQRLEADADEAYLRRMRDDEIGKHHMNAWVNGELDTDDLDRYGLGWDIIDNTLSKQHMGHTPLRNKEIERQRGYRSYRPYEQTMDRKKVNKK